MQGPINFDFGKHWEGRITPWLDDARVQQSLKQGMNQYLRDTARKKRYKSGTCPASHSMEDFYAVLMKAQEERLLEDLRAQGLLPKWYLRLEERFESCDQDSDENEQDLAEEVMQARDSLLEPFFTWDMIKHDIESYNVVGACHWLAPTFELTLAHLVCPEETCMFNQVINIQLLSMLIKQRSLICFTGDLMID